MLEDREHQITRDSCLWNMQSQPLNKETVYRLLGSKKGNLN